MGGKIRGKKERKRGNVHWSEWETTEHGSKKIMQYSGTSGREIIYIIYIAPWTQASKKRVEVHFYLPPRWPKWSLLPCFPNFPLFCSYKYQNRRKIYKPCFTYYKNIYLFDSLRQKCRVFKRKFFAVKGTKFIKIGWKILLNITHGPFLQ